MIMNIDIEPMGRSHIIDISVHVGLKPGWQTGIKDRSTSIANDLASEVQRAIASQLPSQLEKFAK